MALFDRLTEYTAGHPCPHDKDYWTFSEVWENLSGFLLLFSNTLEIAFAKLENHWTGTSQKVLVWIMTLFIYNYQNSDTWSRKEFSHFAAKVKENFVEKIIPKKSQKRVKTFHIKFFKLFGFLLKCVYIGSVSFYSVLWQLGYPVYPFFRI